MPFVANTPESRLDRADSKNPGSTCRGITSSGRPCRRPVASCARDATPPRGRDAGIDLGDETLYCWQHKEQAGHSAQSSPVPPRRHAKPIPEERSSLDTLADRLGIMDLQEKKSRKDGTGRPTPPKGNPHRAKARPKLTLCFCFPIPSADVDRPARPRPKPRPQPGPVQKPKPTTASVPDLQRPSAHGRAPGRFGTSTPSQTARFKHLIPDSLDVTTASALMAELAKPHADSDEGGYIYMFWLTPESQKSKPPTEAARSLLAGSPAVRPSGRGRRASDAVSAFAHGSRDEPGQKTMLLKIGRAANVQRRMNQWQRQCGYDIEMLRYYPYVGGADDRPGTSPTPRMTPHCRKVERLIHIELAGMGLRADMATCHACGREHREWFEVRATRSGIRQVDGVIRRWVDWDEASVE
ncbi:hypothetical protein E4U42_003628 [Claviceps africana]|uniref:Bacteriophage T5 Orf172 DNA-binding domain-containing protein n=1 Tax=Claviceps africana TaxID=83212 RepID=A0A8K0JDN9_9HYPO|nr:hypothetical protein E4U42_003628 [Claviceps africana]